MAYGVSQHENKRSNENVIFEIKSLGKIWRICIYIKDMAFIKNF